MDVVNLVGKMWQEYYKELNDDNLLKKESLEKIHNIHIQLTEMNNILVVCLGGWINQLVEL